MKSNNSSLEQFKDIIGLFNTWEELESVCEKIMGVGIHLIDAKGNFLAQRQQNSKFCQLILSSKKGYSRCQTSYFKKCFSQKTIKKGFCLFKCHAGLTNLSIPITLKDTFLTAILSGGILDKSPDMEAYQNYAQELNLDVSTLINFLNEIKIVSEEDILLLIQRLLPLIEIIKDGMMYHFQLIEKNQYLSNLIKEKEKQLKMIEGKGKVTIVCRRPHHKRRVVITGLGVISPLGSGKEVFWQDLKEGKSGISWISSFDTTNSLAKIAGEIKDFKPLDYMSYKMMKRLSRAIQFGIAASKLALQDARLEINKENREKIGVFIGGGVGGLTFAEDQVIKYVKEGTGKISPFLGINIFGGALSSEISLELGLKGPSVTISTGCPAGTDAIGYAFNSIKNGECEIIISGGTEAPIRPVTLLSFIVMGALSPSYEKPEEVSRPFDAKRDGFVMSEGAGILVLEELNHALKREAHIYAEIVGYALTTDAYHMVVPMPDGSDLSRAIKLALKEANLKPTEINYINAHGSSTPLGDSMETRAIKNVFGDYAYHIPISATKSMLGHSIGVTGAIEAIICALTIEEGFIPPTINYHYHDPNCDLDYVPNMGRKADIKVAMSNSVGFGGKNSSVIFKIVE